MILVCIQLYIKKKKNKKQKTNIYVQKVQKQKEVFQLSLSCICIFCMFYTEGFASPAKRTHISYFTTIFTYTDSVTFVSSVIGDRVWSELVLVPFAMGFVDGVWRVSCV